MRRRPFPQTSVILYRSFCLKIRNKKAVVNVYVPSRNNAAIKEYVRAAPRLLMHWTHDVIGSDWKGSILSRVSGNKYCAGTVNPCCINMRFEWRSGQTLAVQIHSSLQPFDIRTTILAFLPPPTSSLLHFKNSSRLRLTCRWFPKLVFPSFVPFWHAWNWHWRKRTAMSTIFASRWTWAVLYLVITRASLSSPWMPQRMCTSCHRLPIQQLDFQPLSFQSPSLPQFSPSL